MKQILLINDEPELLEICQIILESAGYGIHTALGGGNGIREAMRLKPDLILLDWVMPDMTGGDAMKLLKADATTADIPVLMMSAIPEVRIEARVLVAEGFLGKPFNLEKLQSEIEKILASSDQKRAA